MTDGKTDKKDMTGIFDLPPSEQTAHEAATNPFATETAIEKIDDFESIDQIGMMDHEPAPEAQEEPSLDRHSELPFEVTEAVHEVPPLEMQSDANFEPVQEAAKESPTDLLHDLNT